MPDPEKVAALTRARLSLDETTTIIAALKRRFPALGLPHKDDVCYAPQNRQEALRAVLSESDLALVIGSHSSSNTQRLAELSRDFDVRSYLIDGSLEIQMDWFKDARSVVITAAASAPEQLLQDVMHG